MQLVASALTVPYFSMTLCTKRCLETYAKIDQAVLEKRGVYANAGLNEFILSIREMLSR